MTEQEQLNFWNQIWKQYNRIEANRGYEDAQRFLAKVVNRLDL